MSKTTSDSQSSSSFKNDSLSSDSANQCVPIFNWMSHLFIDEDVGIEDEENCCNCTHYKVQQYSNYKYR